MMEGVAQAIVQHAPDWVLVFGDTDSTLAGAWAATAQGVRWSMLKLGCDRINGPCPRK